MVNDIDDMKSALGLGGKDSWQRPPFTYINPRKDPLIFQQVDCDYYGDAEPIIRIFGVTNKGNSVCCHIRGFAHYLYVRSPQQWGTTPPKAKVEKLQAKFNEAINKNYSMNQTGGRFIESVIPVKKRSLKGWSTQGLIWFLRVKFTMPQYVNKARRVFQENAFILDGQTIRFTEVFEANVPYVMRFMVDSSVVGGGWLELPANQWEMVRTKKSRCQIEVQCRWKVIVAHNDSSGEWMKIAPLRILSYDIECLNRDGGFPEPEKDPVIQISNVVKEQGSNNCLVKNVFVLGTCSKITGAQVICFKTEEELLRAWAEFFTIVDPDLITGYNIQNFDFVYLIKRAEKLRITEKFCKLGRMKDTKTVMKKKQFSSRAYGSSESMDILMEGRVIFDLLPIIRRNHKFRSYTLNAVSFHFLKQQKEDVHYSIIKDLFDGDDNDRRRLAVYCLKDSDLVIRLLDKLMYVVNYVEMARVTGVPIPYLITRGQQIKVQSQLLRKARKKDMVIPVVERQDSGDSVAFEGATVIEPEKGYYTHPITTLDFASLYPSIMMAHNLCYTTLTTKRQMEQEGRVLNVDYKITPRKDVFVTQKLRKGLLPEILEELLSARKGAKKLMKAATNPFEKAVYNGRQLALKVSCNSVYGFTGALNGILPELAISASVTGYGREMIDKTKALVEEKYTIANGYAHDAHVIYGDTDSVMIKFGGLDMAEQMRLGQEAAEYVTTNFHKPILLEFEKVYKPYLLMAKKRYAGLLWTKPKKWDYMDCKGIETVRRDNCPLVKKVVQQVLDHLLIDENKDLAVEYAKRQIAMLLQNKIDISDLVLSSKLGDLKSYKNLNLPHLKVAAKMMKRDPLSAPQMGDRVAYVFVQLGKNAKAYEKAEDPLWVLNQNLPIDTNYYLQNKLKNPIERIFAPCLGGKDKVKSQILTGSHTRCVKKNTSKVGAMMRFAKKSKKCQGCGIMVPEKVKGSLCRKCINEENLIYMGSMRRVQRLERLHHTMWVQCQRCQESLHTVVLCSNRDCPIFYRRQKVKQDLSEAQAKLNLF